MALLAAAGGAQARDPDRPIGDREPDVMDVAKTPVTDLNLSKPGIPALLVEAQQRPYTLQGLGKCAQLTAAVNELDRVLGPDIDLPQAERERFSKGRIAQWAVGTFIPFRSLIRELSGANAEQRRLLSAIQAGMTRRGFLKGVGAARGCRYPASPATAAVVARYQSEKDPDRPPRIEADATVGEAAPDPASAPVPAAKPKVIFKSEPVVQPTR
jgi:hypothetical protein